MGLAHSGRAIRNEVAAMHVDQLLDGLVDSVDVANALKTTHTALVAKAKDPLSGFPPAFKIGKRTYFSIAGVRRWIAIQAGLDFDEVV